ncbi:MAG TPA: hypothetical protein VD846_04610 [Allosphingosinicella sp.]|nr:hypothetical protein [Allosphingosinicella sp.]
MDLQQPERTCAAASAEPKAEWTAPQVDKLVAGGAEASAGADVEGLDGLS